MTNEKASRFERSKKYYAIIGVIILGIAFVHFGLQMTFIQKENLRSAENTIENENNLASDIEKNVSIEKIIEIQPEQFKIKEIEVKIPEPKAVARRQVENVEPEKRVVRKKEMPETRSERLRRAEKILTGI